MGLQPAVTIIGAGIAGLTLARALALRGMAVSVLEQAAEITEVGAGIQISPNGAAVMAALGLAPALMALSMRATTVSLHDGFTDAPVMQMDLTRAVGAFHLIHRADLIAMLRQGAEAAGATIRLNSRVERVDATAALPILHFSDGQSEPASMLIGADGLHSPARRALNGAEQPFFTNQVAWRATIKNSGNADGLVEVHMGHGRHLVSYPLRDGSLRNIVAVEERPGWAAESWSLQDDPAHLQAAFARFSPKVRGWLAQVEHPNLWGLFRHPVAAIWQKTLPAGAIAILGDAAHPTLPFLAQGANMALEDAWCLAEALCYPAGSATGLAAYEALRKTRTAAIVAAANGNARAYHLAGPLRQIAHLGLRIGSRVAPNFALGRFDWIYRHDVTAKA